MLNMAYVILHRGPLNNVVCIHTLRTLADCRIIMKGKIGSLFPLHFVEESTSQYPFICIETFDVRKRLQKSDPEI